MLNKPNLFNKVKISHNLKRTKSNKISPTKLKFTKRSPSNRIWGLLKSWRLETRTTCSLHLKNCLPKLLILKRRRSKSKKPLKPSKKRDKLFNQCWMKPKWVKVKLLNKKTIKSPKNKKSWPWDSWRLSRNLMSRIRKVLKMKKRKGNSVMISRIRPNPYWKQQIN